MGGICVNGVVSIIFNYILVVIIFIKDRNF